MPYKSTKTVNTKSGGQGDPPEIPEWFQPYAIVEEKYIKSMVIADEETGERIQTPSRYVEILVPDSSYYDFLPTDVAFGSLAYLLDEGALLFFNGDYWSDVGEGGNGFDDDDNGGNVVN